MQIIIGVAGFYDWEPAPDAKPTEDEILRMDYKSSVDDVWLRKVLVDSPSETQISIPESQIETLMEHFDRRGNPKTREQTYAWFIEEQVMPDHAPAALWRTIQVQGKNKDLEQFLARRFDITADASVLDAAAPSKKSKEKN